MLLSLLLGINSFLTFWGFSSWGIVTKLSWILFLTLTLPQGRWGNLNSGQHWEGIVIWLGLTSCYLSEESCFPSVSSGQGLYPWSCCVLVPSSRVGTCQVNRALQNRIPMNQSLLPVFWPYSPTVTCPVELIPQGTHGQAHICRFILSPETLWSGQVQECGLANESLSSGWRSISLVRLCMTGQSESCQHTCLADPLMLDPGPGKSRLWSSYQLLGALGLSCVSEPLHALLPVHVPSECHLWYKRQKCWKASFSLRAPLCRLHATNKQTSRGSCTCLPPGLSRQLSYVTCGFFCSMSSLVSSPQCGEVMFSWVVLKLCCRWEWKCLHKCLSTCCLLLIYHWNS